MNRRRSAAYACAVVCGVLSCARPASAQSHPPVTASAAPDAVRWSGSVGLETMSLRDIARTGRPVTASPIAWEGSGPVFQARVTRENERRLHVLQLAGSTSGSFEYRSPLASRPTSGRDRARYFDLRYEYRRYPFRNLILRGFDVGLGVEGSGARTSFRRHIEPSTETNEARTNAGIGGSLAARLRRWERVGAEVAWTNGLIIGRRNERWSVGNAIDGGGGGWVTTLSAQADARISGQARIFAAYTGSGEGFLASHRSYALGRRRVTMGVAYGR